MASTFPEKLVNDLRARIKELEEENSELLKKLLETSWEEENHRHDAETLDRMLNSW